MTRVLSELLQAREPHFRIALRQLEHAAGAPSEDIRLTNDVNLQVKDKLRDLNLDPRDTTGEELYHALHGRVRRDNAMLLHMLHAGGTGDGNLMPRIERLMNGLQLPRQVFALKNVCAKKILKANPPKRVMKQLGYRSLDSMLKHEPAGVILAAARLAETATWHKTLQAAYKKLTGSDFETRDGIVVAPAHARWATFAAPYVAEHKYNVLAVPEMGVVTLLPITGHEVEGAPLAATLLALQAMQDMRASSTYLKLAQVRPDFGTVLAQVARQEPATSARLLKMPLPWKLVHTFFARNPDAYRAELFEPHVRKEDLHHMGLCDSLSHLHPSFAFWQGTSHLGMHHDSAGVSFHPLDAVLNFINRVPYDYRMTKQLRTHLWQELLLRYMRQGNLAADLREQLSDELMPQAALV